MKLNWLAAELAASGIVVAAGVTSGQAQPTQAIRAGSLATGSPFSVQDATGAWRGFIIDVLAEAGRRQGFTATHFPIPNAELPTALLGNQIDVIAANFAITPERQAVVTFSVPYSLGTEGMLVPKTDTANHTSFEDFRGQPVGALANTTHATWLATNASMFSATRTYATRNELMAALVSGEIKAARVAGAVYAYVINVEGSFPDVRFVESYVPLDRTQSAFAVRPGDTDLLAKLDAAIVSMKADGTLAQLGMQWQVVPAP